MTLDIPIRGQEYKKLVTWVLEGWETKIEGGETTRGQQEATMTLGAGGTKGGTDIGNHSHAVWQRLEPCWRSSHLEDIYWSRMREGEYLGFLLFCSCGLFLLLPLADPHQRLGNVVWRWAGSISGSKYPLTSQCSNLRKLKYIRILERAV